MREVSRETAIAVASQAMEAGSYWKPWPDGNQLKAELEWDVSGKCHEPRPVEIYGRYHFRDRRNAALTNAVADSNPVTVILWTRCRRCMWCKARRAELWMARAADEYQRSARTWFSTLTLDADAQYQALARAREDFESLERFFAHAENRKPRDFEGLREIEKFARRVRAIGPELTRFIKRVRKNSGARMRYLLVAERHQSGAPHFHMLIHEGSVDQPIRKAVLKDAWHLGYTAFKLVDDPRAASYVCKYLAKDACTRVRASFRYGLLPDFQVGGETTVVDRPGEKRAVRERVPKEREQTNRVTF